MIVLQVLILVVLLAQLAIVLAPRASAEWRRRYPRYINPENPTLSEPLPRRLCEVVVIQGVAYHTVCERAPRIESRLDPIPQGVVVKRYSHWIVGVDRRVGR